MISRRRQNRQILLVPINAKGRDNSLRLLAATWCLAEADLGKLASAWHSDMDLGRELEVVTDMTKSRLAGFHEYQPTLGSFLDLFARLREDRIIPAWGSTPRWRRTAGRTPGVRPTNQDSSTERG
jgi:hypothetical protein